ncbi:hypothetical protein HaLaN_19588 [Haematococcus lacustris]|uniref:Uncharacterized protein n=1 Tax=Haematococcus lacustris TaxID=44745 RepID=A0A699ZHI0_HAELA|nr:hypothetical protein HaLaN_19588 [Haematococcus lacustris]
MGQKRLDPGKLKLSRQERVQNAAGRLCTPLLAVGLQLSLPGGKPAVDWAKQHAQGQGIIPRTSRQSRTERNTRVLQCKYIENCAVVMPSHRRSVCLPVVATGLLVCLMLSQGVFAQPTDPPAPSPAVLASRPPAPPMYTPSPQLSTATGTSLDIVFYGLDFWSLLTSWGSGMQALLEAQQPPSLRLQDLSAPGMCASHLLALNTTALLNTSRTAQELMPALSYFARDVAQLMRDYLRDASITVNVPDFCAGNRTFASFFANGTRVNETWPTLRVTINLPTMDPER